MVSTSWKFYQFTTRCFICQPPFTITIQVKNHSIFIFATVFNQFIFLDPVVQVGQRIILLHLQDQRENTKEHKPTTQSSTVYEKNFYIYFKATNIPIKIL